MSAGFVVATLDLGDVEKGLGALAAGSSRLRAFAAAFRMLKPALQVDQQEHAKSGQGPDGPWVGRSAATMARRAYKGHRAAKRPLGRLPSAIQYTSDALGVYGRPRVAWWRAIQDGERVGKGHRSKLPARAFWWIGDQVLDFAVFSFEHLLTDAWAGRI